MVFEKSPSWVKRSMKTAFFAVVLLFVIAIGFSLFNMFRSNFSCHSGGLIGFSGGSYSLGNCFGFPMMLFIFALAPIAIIGLIVGIIIDMVLFFVHKYKKN